MWFLVYNLLNILLSPVIIIILLAKKRCRPGLMQRLGIRLPHPTPKDKPVIWIHAVSLGEATAVVPLIHAMHERYPWALIMVSTITETGREVVQERLPGVAHHCYFPLDWPWVVRRYVENMRPAVFIVVETELWPNVLRYLSSHGVPTILVNGRLSSRSFDRYLWVRSFMAQIVSMMSLILVQSERDQDRFVKLGVSPERIQCTGSMKFDQADSKNVQPVDHTLDTIRTIERDEEWIIAGSTHPEEELMLLRIFQEISRVHPQVNLLLAPRHVERANKLEQTVRNLGIRVFRRTKMGNHNEVPGPRVMILDTRGELAQVYKLASLTFVGGTLVPMGGHNLLEPARWAKPVYFGPYTDHCQEIATLLIDSGGGVQVQNEKELLASFMRGLNDPEWRERMGHAAKGVVQKNQGVVQRNLDLISRFIDGRAIPT